jgi:hypothetical protein
MLDRERRVWARDWYEMDSDTRDKSRYLRREHFESAAQQLMAKEACGATKCPRLAFVRPSNLAVTDLFP